MDLDRTLLLVKEVLEEIFNLQNPPAIVLSMDKEGTWRLQATKTGADYVSGGAAGSHNVIFDKVFEWPSEAIFALVDQVRETIEDKHQKVARLNDRLSYYLKEPEQKAITFGRRIVMKDDPDPDIPF